MASKRKPRRRMVHSVTFGFHDGAVIACGPSTKPSNRRIKEEGIYVCPDGVFSEHYYSPTYWHTFKLEERREITATLANRLNTRRAIRELVMPQLEAIQQALDSISKRLEQIERQK